ncbi:hypothetical protein U0070_019540 [Myodes glareolus]|uniref:Uncharacterized protein n=1 Tax=Myodes glareolus TaxID=447135 RepID=A0AAW0GWH1_MYOGA
MEATLQRLKAEEYVQQKRELLALYRNQGKESPNTRPSTPSLEDSQSSAEGRTLELSIIPSLVVTEDTDEDAPSMPDDTSDSGYGTLIPSSPKTPRTPLNRLRAKALRRDPRLTFSTLELRDVPLRPQPPDPQAPQRRSAPDLPDGILRGGSLPRRAPPTWSEEEDETLTTRNVVVETLNRAQRRSPLPQSPTPTDSAGESPWESSDEEEGLLSPGLRPRPLQAEDMLREIREELATQRIEGASEPGDGKPRKLTRAQLRRMRGTHIIQLDTPLSTSHISEPHVKLPRNMAVWSTLEEGGAVASSWEAGRGRVGGGAFQRLADVLHATIQVHVAKHTVQDVQRGLVAWRALPPGFQHAVLSLAQAAPVLQFQPLDLVLAQPQEPHELLPAQRRHAVHHRIQRRWVCNWRQGTCASSGSPAILVSALPDSFQE